ESLPRLRVGNRFVECRPRDAEPARGDVDPLRFEARHDMFETVALFAADHVLDRYDEVVVVEFARLDALVAEIADVAADGEARPIPAGGSPCASGGRKRRFCSSVPKRTSTSHSTRCAPRMPASPIHPRESSSNTIANVV